MKKKKLTSKKKLTTRQKKLIGICLFLLLCGLIVLIVYLVNKSSSPGPGPSPGPTPGPRMSNSSSAGGPLSNPLSEWLPIKNMLVARDWHASVSAKGIVFVIGGAGNNANTWKPEIASVEGYTPATSGSPATWTEMASMATARYALAAVALNVPDAADPSHLDATLYALGGYTTSPYGTITVADVEVLTVGTGTWAKGTPMNTVRASFGAAVVAGKIVAVGGGTADGWPTASVEIFHPAVGGLPPQWVPAASMATRRSGHCVVALGPLVYAMGGVELPAGSLLNTVEAYDIMTDTWTTIAPMNRARSNFAAAAVAGKLYVMGGQASAGAGAGGLVLVEFYDPVTKVWTDAPPMNTARVAGAATAMMNSIYVTGGEKVADSPSRIPALTSAEVFSVPPISTERHY